MKNNKITTTIVFLFSFSNYIFAQQLTRQELDTFDHIDFTSVVNCLFDMPEIDKSKENTITWTPNYSEKQSFNISFDGKCHTSLDTVLVFKNNLQEKSVAFIFKTQIHSQKGEIIGSHFSKATVSIAIFSATSSKTWALNSFHKYFTDSGLFGGAGKEGIGKFSIVNIDDQIFLSLKHPIEGNNGINLGVEDIYFIDGNLCCDILSHVFSYQYYIEKNEKEIRQNLDLKKSRNDYFIIVTHYAKRKKFVFDFDYCKFL